ncbi:hypothetical protein T03_6722 [Trichinella britovi]|uniref:Uncharacterized protein n=1 Tax=Trichinella britovi TaxID=45882 RepID=A0A0V1CYQ8_TRIBR|nr:hypothetical protein T03_6722 [Trichinella britovi]
MCQPGRIGNFDFVDAEKCQADKRKSNPDPALAPEVSHQYMCQRQERQLSIDHQICRILYIRNENHPKTVCNWKIDLPWIKWKEFKMTIVVKADDTVISHRHLRRGKLLRAH